MCTPFTLIFVGRQCILIIPPETNIAIIAHEHTHFSCTIQTVDFPASYVSFQECIDVKRIIFVGNMQILGVQNLQIAHLSKAYKRIYKWSYKLDPY